MPNFIQRNHSDYPPLLAYATKRKKIKEVIDAECVLQGQFRHLLIILLEFREIMMSI